MAEEKEEPKKASRIELLEKAFARIKERLDALEERVKGLEEETW